MDSVKFELLKIIRDFNVYSIYMCNIYYVYCEKKYNVLFPIIYVSQYKVR